MTFTKSRFVDFDEYLMADPGDLPEGFYEYWNGELVPVMSESIGNDAIANFIFLMLIQIGVPIKLIRPHSCEIVVPGKPRTRLPDLTVLDEIHLILLKKRATITQTMPPPRIVMEVVSPGNETSDNYLRDYRDKPDQYAAIGILEFWRIDRPILLPLRDKRALPRLVQSSCVREPILGRAFQLSGEDD